MKAMKASFCSGVTLTSMLMVAPAWAQATPEATAPQKSDIAEGSDIVVTATKANEIAPVTVSLATTQPQAIVSRSFIEDSLPATADFNQLALITPSFSNTGSNGGVGVSESKGQLRGFQDGEYNITYDGVPFGDTNDPTHHSNTFFPSNTVETLVVDRGPGNASNLGQATFGGSVNLFSRATREDPSATFRAAYGTFNTFLGRAMLQSGSIDKLGGTQILLGGQYVRTDGRLTYSPYHQTNLFGKVVIPIGPDVRLTLVSTYNKNHFNQPDNDGATLAQVAQFGKTFSLNNDPTTPQYQGYNYTDKTTDFEIVKLEADIAPGTRFENRTYTYYYNNSTLSAADVTGGTPNQVTAADGKTKIIGHVPGYTKLNSYRVYGDIAKAIIDLGPATLTTGAWIEWSVTHRKRYQYDLTAGGPAANAFDYNQKTPAGVPKYINYDQDSRGNQQQLFAELEIRPFENLKITPGIKYIDFTRSVNAIANQKTHAPAIFSESWDDTLPFVTINYQPIDGLAIYAQYARGFLAPPLDVLQIQNPAKNTVEPQRSTNYQLGFVYHGSHLSIDADVYSIDFTNKFQSKKDGAGDTVFYNSGGALYKGIEGQVTYAFDNGLALFANASRNYAKTKDTRLQVANAPFMTAAGGILYRHGGIKASLIDKYTGVQYGDDAQTPDYRIPGYNTAIVSLGYDFGRFAVEGTVSDLFDSTKVTNITVNGAPYDQYYFQPGREVSISLTAKF
ncbi:TonB-dependent receptor [Sphingomonas sp. H39-1-10]|uniref:TonB-dependent receptor n=1 Tax=Sphingomonas pollutisoli TaxID=3030829 RepID=UPI0023B93192|nr:TonB-dependent receptor [Sphingomonas pollutisoli]MDF0491376.1 TonB-dependent receptor [Sphingomonas pollutisoli]